VEGTLDSVEPVHSFQFVVVECAHGSVLAQEDFAARRNARPRSTLFASRSWGFFATGGFSWNLS